MTDMQLAREPSQVSEESLTEDSKYYSPVRNNCIAYSARATSHKHKELEAQRSEIIRGPYPSSEDVCYLPKALVTDKYREAQLHIVTTNRRIKVFGKWTEQKLLAVVTDRLIQRATSIPLHPYEQIPPMEITPISARVAYDSIIHRGIYSEGILRQLYCSGASESVLIKAMKFGLRHLKPEDLNYFVQFGVSIPVLRSRKLRKDLIDESLVVSLRTMGFDEVASKRIILNGMLAQNEICLMQLMLAGVDVPGILNWQGPMIEAGACMIQFLKKLGITDDVLHFVVQKGVDEETNEMLKDLGYIETEGEEYLGMHEVVVCECDLIILESEVSSVVCQSCNNDSLRSLDSRLDYSKASIEAREACACSLSRNNLTCSHLTITPPSLITCKDSMSSQSSLRDSELVLKRNEYLRQTVMVPLVWAMTRALQHRPSDPKYYIACQLVRWRYGGVCESEMRKTKDFVIARTIEMDNKLLEKKKKEKDELIAKREAEILQNIPCHPCWERQQIHRVKERCWKCIRKWVPNFEPCELPDICSSCKVNLSDIINSESSTITTGNFSSAAEVKIVFSKNLSQRSFLSSYQHSYPGEIESLSY